MVVLEQYVVIYRLLTLRGSWPWSWWRRHASSLSVLRRMGTDLCVSREDFVIMDRDAWENGRL